MGERRVGFWLGWAAIVAGLVFALVFTSREGLALGGCGLIVIGAMSVAIGFDDPPAD